MLEPAGVVKLVRESRLLTPRGRWTAIVDDSGFAQALQFRLATTTSLTLNEASSSGSRERTLAEGTTLQFDALLEVDEASGRVAALVDGGGSDTSGLAMREGRIRVQVPSQLSLTLGVAEFSTIGSFRARPAPGIR